LFSALWGSFFGALFIIVLVSLLAKPEPVEKLQGLVYGLVKNGAPPRGKRAGHGHGVSTSCDP
jgi:hypothetical protein